MKNTFARRKKKCFKVELEELPAGYSMSSGRSGDSIMVSHQGFYSSEDGELLIKRLEGWPDHFLNLLPAAPPLKPSCIDTLLVIIKKNKTAKIYLNSVQPIVQTRIKGGCQKGDPIFTNRILDIGKMEFKDMPISEGDGFLYVFSVGWRQGFIYDLEPLHQKDKRNYEVGEVLGSCFAYLLFQDRFKIDEKTWEVIFSQKWFPFSYLDDKLIKKMISHAREGWEIDDFLLEIHKQVVKLIKESLFVDGLSLNFDEHKVIIEKAIERYLEGDYISCTSILYPRIEGIMRSFHKNQGYISKQSSINLSKSAILHHDKSRIHNSLLLPDKFKKYLENIYFASFTPGSSPGVGRHSVAHGEARIDEFNLKSSTLAILVLSQLSLFMKV
jgi:hypothetical protein